MIFSSIGEVVEWFDFMVYLFAVLARVFFAEGSRSPVLVTLGIFAAAFLARPIGLCFLVNSEIVWDASAR